MGGGPSERPTLQPVEVGHDLEALFRDAGPELWRAIYGFTGGRRQLAEDAVAEAFARAIEHRDGIRDPLAWIYRTAFRLASRELQREKRQPPQPPDPSPGIDPFDVQEILAALARLSPNQRAAVLLHDEEGFTGPGGGTALGDVGRDGARPSVPRTQAPARVAEHRGGLRWMTATTAS